MLPGNVIVPALGSGDRRKQRNVSHIPNTVRSVEMYVLKCGQYFRNGWLFMKMSRKALRDTRLNMALTLAAASLCSRNSASEIQTFNATNTRVHHCTRSLVNSIYRPSHKPVP